jgi:hypothetical protein
LSATLGFIAIVATLHFAQTAYDPKRQLMSELALGPHGRAVLPAFGLLALSLLAVQHGLRLVESASAPRTMLVVAAIAMLAAGVFPLGRSTVSHIVLVAIGSSLIIGAMFLAAARPGVIPSKGVRVASCVLGAGAVVSVAAANVGLPLGIAQRIAAGCVVGWLCLLSARLIQRGI